VHAKDKEITDGPNFNQRVETHQNVLYALRNGGFSGKIMPQNLVTGAEADQVADFLAKYAGKDAKNPAAPTQADDGADAQPATESNPGEGGGSTNVPTTTPSPDGAAEAGASTADGLGQ
jgi:hypothetical protein